MTNTTLFVHDEYDIILPDNTENFLTLAEDFEHAAEAVKSRVSAVAFKEYSDLAEFTAKMSRGIIIDGEMFQFVSKQDRAIMLECLRKSKLKRERQPSAP
jgi:hypothetical protein